jgi:hypothetical protein
MMRFKSFAQAIAVIGLSIFFLLTGFVRPAMSQSDENAKKAALPKLSLSPKKLNFGNEIVTLTSAPKTITLTNHSATEAISLAGIAVSPPFLQTGGTCGATIAPSATCTIDIAFTPTAAGKFKQSKGLTLTDSAQKSPQRVALQGKGVIGSTPVPTATPTATATTTFTATATATATATLTVTATPTATGSGDATPTATPTSTGSGSATPTATPTSTGSGSATPTPTPGPQAGDVLIAGGDSGGLVAGIVEFTMDTVSTNAAAIYKASSNAFGSVGTLNTAREGAATVVLPNGETLVVGGQHCFAKTIGPGGACGSSTFSGFECDALDTAELYTETGASTGAFSIAGSGSDFAMTTARNGATATLLADGVSVLIVGGSSGSSFLGLSVPAGCAPSGQVTQNTAEIYDTLTDTFTPTAAIPGCPAGTIPPTQCTNNMGDALPAVCGPDGMSQCGLIDSAATLLTSGWAPGGVLVTGGDYIEFFAEASTQAFVYVPYYLATDGTPFWAPSNPMNTAREEPGIVTLPSGDVLVEGGLVATASNCLATPSTPIEFTTMKTAEIFDPTMFTWTTVAAPMSVPRIAPVEFFASGPDAGKAIIAGGVDDEAGAGTTCVATTSIVEKTQSSTDLFTENVDNPASSTFTPTGALNVDRAGYAVTILNSGAHSGDLAVFGGSCSENTLASSPIGSSIALTNCGKSSYKSDYYELFDPGAGTWSVGTATAPATPAAGPASGLLQ